MSGGEGSASALWRIIGIGSPVVGDDLGWLAIDWLRDAGFDPHAELLTLDRPGPALLDYLEPDVQIILIDAMDAGLPAGTLCGVALDDLLTQARPPSSHDLGLAETLALAKALGVLPVHLHLLGIQMAGAGAQRPSSETLALEVVRRVSAIMEPEGSA